MRRPRMTMRMADAIIGAANLATVEYADDERMMTPEDRKLLRLYEDLERWAFRNSDWLEWRAKQREEAWNTQG